MYTYYLFIAKSLLKKKPRINVSAKNNKAFRNACKNNHLDIAKLLVLIDPEIIRSTIAKEAFYNACFAGHLNIVQWFIGVGVMPNTEPLIQIDVIKLQKIFALACEHNYLDVVIFLLKNYPNLIKSVVSIKTRPNVHYLDGDSDEDSDAYSSDDSD